MTNELVPCAKWEDGGEGHISYEGRLISIFSILNADPPGAYARIQLDCGLPGPAGLGQYITLTERNFTGRNEVDVKLQVEEWVKQKFDLISELVSHIE